MQLREEVRSRVWIALLVMCPMMLWGQTGQPNTGVPQEKSPALKSFVPQFFENLKSTFTSKENILPLAIGGGATALARIGDGEVQEYFGGDRIARRAGGAGQWMGSAAVLGGLSGTALIAGYTSGNQKLSRLGFDLGQAMLLSQGLTQAVKYTVRRERPNYADRHSFVSGHASGSMAFAVVVGHHFPKARIPILLAASFVSFGRLEKNRHWLSDTIGGATLGVIVAQTVVREDKKLSIGRVTFTPHIPPGGGIAVNASVGF